jgi:L-glutamine-phosphate cytidylyltransferase
MIAIICAAGIGKRLRPLTLDRPKPLIKVGSKTILEHMVDALENLGIKKIRVVVGYQRQKVIKTLGRKNRKCDINYLYNRDFDTTNNIYSLYLAMQETIEDVIFFNGDIIFNKIVLKNILQSKHNNSIIVSNSKPKSFDSMKVTIDKNKVLDIGKNIDGQISGEAFGIYRLTHQSVKDYLNITEKLFSKDINNRNISFVEPLKKMFIFRNIRPVYCDEKYFVEIDTIDDYNNAQKQINEIVG